VDEQRYRNAERALFADAGIDPIERRIDLPTLGTAARVLEVGEGHPAVFLHGGPDAAATWSYLAAAAEGVRCYLVDRPGCGLSEPPPAIPTAAELPGYVAQLSVDVLDALELDQATLVGCSFGGYSALRSAAAHPSRVEGVVLAGCPAFVSGWSPPRFAALLRTPLLGRLLLAAPATPRTVGMSLRQLGHERSLAAGRIPEAMLAWVLAWQRHTDTLRNDAAMIIGCGTWRGGFDPSLDLEDRDLCAVQAPCLVLSGTDDPVGGIDVTRRLASALPDATVEVLDHVGHLPWLDDPVRVATHISEFATTRVTR
jgi:pimeloyl-ACP methyl ester carboxylesterase